MNRRHMKRACVYGIQISVMIFATFALVFFARALLEGRDITAQQLMGLTRVAAIASCGIGAGAALLYFFLVRRE